MIKLVIHGAAGRMGARVGALARRDDRFVIAAETGREQTSVECRSDEREPVVVIDFSSDEGTRRAAEIALRSSAALVVGTTALSAQTLDVLGVLARSAAVLVAPNTSLGVAVLKHLAAEAARLLRGRCDVDIIEQHHRHKRDAPSGTALAIVRRLAEVDLEVPGDRVHAIRAGETVGDHVVQFAQFGETLRLEHRALARDVFAAGALDAAAWLAGRPAGRYTMEQVLGLEVGG